MSDIDTSQVDVVILCGGLGTRLRGVVDDRPKVMVEIDGRPFLDILIDEVARHGFRRFVLCTGYRGDVIDQHYRQNDRGLRFRISHEDEPLGTAGALKRAEPQLESALLLALNGDSLCRLDLRDFLAFHVRKGAAVTLALSAVDDAADYGIVELDASDKITRFAEKASASGPGLVNAGVYALGRPVLEAIPAGQSLSLERDVFPRILDQGVYGYRTLEGHLDIGTPDRLRAAQDDLARRTPEGKR